MFTPTLTGLGERSHLLDPKVTLDTHVEDVANLLLWEDLSDVILVGHSYGGIVARQVADRMPERIRSLIYLDAFVPDDGKSLFDYLPDGGASNRELARAVGEGWKLPPLPAASLVVNAEDVEWVDRSCTMHPLAAFEAPAVLEGACDRIADIGYIRATKPTELFESFYQAAGDRGWWRAELHCGHDIMLDMPDELASLLLARV